MRNKRRLSLQRHFGSTSLRSAGVFDSTYGITDDADRDAITTATENLRRSIMRLYSRDATRRGGDEWDAAVRFGMRS